MTKEDIIPSRTDVLSMAWEAGMNVVDDQYSLLPFLERFAALIASRVAEQEREACVTAVSDALYGRAGCGEAIAAIRARGETSSRGQA